MVHKQEKSEEEGRATAVLCKQVRGKGGREGIWFCVRFIHISQKHPRR
jgi:hypothetical protein